MILSDKSIHEAIESGRLGIDPFDPNLIQPSSIDVRLDNKFLVFRNTKRAFIDVKQPADDLMEMIEVGHDEPMFLHPHEFVLGSTIERVRMPNDLVARLEGRSSLGRLGIVIHSSLPYDSPVLFLEEGGVPEPRPIGEIVENRLRGKVVGFDRDTFEVGFHEVTNWFRELPDKIYEVRLASGRRIQVTAGHNLFTLDSAGNLIKTPTGELTRGSLVAIPKWIPEPGAGVPEYRVADLMPTSLRAQLIEDGDRVKLRGEASLPASIRVDREIAWVLGLYVAEGYKRNLQVTISNTDQTILDRAEVVFESLGQRVYRAAGAITCCSKLVSALFDGLSMGRGAPSKRLPKGALGWPWQLLDSLLEGLIDGDGSVRRERDCLSTTSDRLVSDVLLLCARLGKRAVTQTRPPRPGCFPEHVVSIANNRHKVLTATPNPADLLVDVRSRLGLTQVHASKFCGFTRPTSRNNVERGRNRRAVHIATLERIYDSYSTMVPTVFNPIGRLTRLVNSDIQWDKVAEVAETGRFEVVYDLEVRSQDATVENFLAGYGGIFASNTAGFIDPAFDGHVTLEISNSNNLPVALYPRMRIGQLSFSLMTTPAERPYGPARGSKYSGQDVPTASRLYLDFQQP